MNTIQQQEELLFSEWETQLREKKNRLEMNYEHADAFYRDGVIDPRQYWSAGVRLVFALREPNFKKPDGDIEYKSYKLSDEIPSNPHVFWTRKVAPFCVGFQMLEAPNNSFSIEEIWEKARVICEDPGEASKYLTRYGYVQLKKIPGSAAIDPKQFAGFVTGEKTFLRRQFEIYQPDIIVACGISFPRTFDLLEGEVFPRTQDRTMVGSIEWRCARVHAGRPDGKPTFIIETMHPSHRSSREKVFLKLMSDFLKAVELLRQSQGAKSTTN